MIAMVFEHVLQLDLETLHFLVTHLNLKFLWSVLQLHEHDQVEKKTIHSNNRCTMCLAQWLRKLLCQQIAKVTDLKLILFS